MNAWILSRAYDEPYIRGTWVARFMRIAFMGMVLLLLVAPVAAQQNGIFPEAHQYRLGFSDLEHTDAVEDAGEWHLHIESQFLNLNDTFSTAYVLPDGFSFQGATVDCTLNCSVQVRSRTAEGELPVEITPLDAGSFNATLGLTLRGPSNLEYFGTEIDMPEDSLLIVYVFDQDVVASKAAGSVLPSITQPGVTHYLFRGEEGPLRVSVLPAGTIPDPTPAVKEGFSLVIVLGAFVLGVALWYVLVQQGLVQAKKRKQVVSKAAHQTITDDKPTLEARKRVLLAALKELELAKGSGDLDLGIYDQLKAQYKKEAVTVLRALETAE